MKALIAQPRLATWRLQLSKMSASAQSLQIRRQDLHDGIHCNSDERHIARRVMMVSLSTEK